MLPYGSGCGRESSMRPYTCFERLRLVAILGCRLQPLNSYQESCKRAIDQSNPAEVEIDIDSLDLQTFLKLKKYVDDCIKRANKKKQQWKVAHIFRVAAFDVFMAMIQNERYLTPLLLLLDFIVSPLISWITISHPNHPPPACLQMNTCCSFFLMWVSIPYFPLWSCVLILLKHTWVIPGKICNKVVGKITKVTKYEQMLLDPDQAHSFLNLRVLGYWCQALIGWFFSIVLVSTNKASPGNSILYYWVP